MVSGKKKWVKQGAILTDILTEKGAITSDGFRQKEMGYVCTVGGVRQEEMGHVVLRGEDSSMESVDNSYSVLMSVYHKEKAEYLKQAMDSIWNQSVPTDDFVLVCDGPLTTELD